MVLALVCYGDFGVQRLVTSVRRLESDRTADGPVLANSRARSTHGIYCDGEGWTLETSIK